jgi:hypothetical protein
MKRNVLCRVAMATISVAVLNACQPNLLNEESSPDPSKSGRVGADWLTDSRVAYGSRKDATNTMALVNASPRLHRQKIESRVLQDGSMEMTTEQLRPQQLDKLPPGLRNWKEMGPHRTMVAQNQATFYDQSNRAISQRPTKTVNHIAQIHEMRETKGLAKNSPLTIRGPLGYPKVDAATIRKAMKESGGEAKQLSKFVVQVRQNQSTPESKEYVLTTFDTYNGRVLTSEVRDSATSRLLFRSACRYKNDKEGIKLVGVYSETYIEDALTGMKAKEISYQTIQNAQFVDNI